MLLIIYIIYIGYTLGFVEVLGQLFFRVAILLREILQFLAKDISPKRIFTFQQKWYILIYSNIKTIKDFSEKEIKCPFNFNRGILYKVYLKQSFDTKFFFFLDFCIFWGKCCFDRINVYIWIIHLTIQFSPKQK